jgi:hypothetical protein
VAKQTPVEAICHLPASFYAGSKSFAQLVRESGITDPASGASTEALAALLRTDRALIDGWLLWSENKRASSGWFLQRDGDGCIVGYFPGGERLRFDDVALGCAKFILHEVGLPHAL